MRKIHIYDGDGLPISMDAIQFLLITIFLLMCGALGGWWIHVLFSRCA